MHIHYKNHLLLTVVTLLPKATGYGIINRTTSDPGKTCQLPACVVVSFLSSTIAMQIDVADVGSPAAEVVKAGSAHISTNKAQMHSVYKKSN